MANPILQHREWMPEGSCDVKGELDLFCKFHDIERKFIDTYKGKQSKIKILRNLVDYEIGELIFNILLNKNNENKNNKQITIFDWLQQSIPGEIMVQ